METSVPAVAVRSRSVVERRWLHSRGWDLTYISMSVVLVAAPYLIYLGLMRLPSLVQQVAQAFGATPDSLARNLVNAVVALLVGGPHMYATFTRTALDNDFVRKHPRLIWSSALIPVVVTTLAFLNLSVLLTLFFFWASVHVLHQIIFITDLYNQRERHALTLFARLSDYAVILTALYPLAGWKISTGDFTIGQNDLSAVIGSVVPLGPWMVWLAGTAFGVALVVWLLKSLWEWQRGMLHGPKTLFIGLTVTAAFFVPALGNLDTAFQGMNVWHSLQYLALTWVLNNVRQSRGELDRSPFVKRMSQPGSARRYYIWNIALTVGDVALAGILFVLLHYIFQRPFDYAFDRAYYIAVLSFLWIHYYHDHYLFTQPKVIGEPA